MMSVSGSDGDMLGEPVPVIIHENKDKTPQDVRVMGCSRGVMKSQLITSTSANNPPMLAGKDPRRSQICIIFQVVTGGVNTIVYFGEKDEVQQAALNNANSGPGIWPARVPGGAPPMTLLMNHTDEVYIALGATDANSVIATVVTERWDTYHGTA
jgi:hypothetical protein